jgi:hypothetical protein
MDTCPAHVDAQQLRPELRIWRRNMAFQAFQAFQLRSWSSNAIPWADFQSARKLITFVGATLLPQQAQT